MSPRAIPLGPGLRLLMQERGIKAKDLAATAGIAAPHLSEITNGKRTLTPALLGKLGKALGIPTDALKSRLMELSVKVQSEGAGFPGNPAGSSARIREDGVTYGRAMNQTPPDADILLAYLVRSMTRDQQFALLNEFMQAAQAGDAEAFAKARALFDLIEPEAAPVPP
jgi:transcriptional regulator with XRE-family HTH domain